ncbi:replication protein P [Vibrio sp. 1978]|uniref:replication protein P n=1 Tax=Vibrio sp. 1978 TaxID=3074585 RepID=UPI0029672184|nr:replication protein P [Vibrio sp. 1978]MDW3058704.1 replication protein P [Vibrio sp. 1978]
MKSVVNLAQGLSVVQGHLDNHQEARMDDSRQTANHVNQIFKELLQACPAWNVRFEKKPQELADLKRSYLKGLVENNLYDLREIQYGIRKARSSESDFFPSVGKFISWCKPSAEDMGYPTAREAFNRIAEYNSQDTRYSLPPLILATFNQIGHWDLTHLPEAKLFPIFESQYGHLIKRLVAGEDISVFCPKALPTPEQRTKTQGEKEQDRKNGLSMIASLKAKHFGR